MADDISSQIWQMFGKNRDKYISRDVFSDDEDMEAGVSDVEKEERIRSVLLSARDTLDSALVLLSRYLSLTIMLALPFVL
ncbi:hypothetical protein K474DRAFT_1659951 [Panus rudis PR-1116 ss-1]|nr:hypothetical protein K474DRAFT_1659951 [Panus rudis PR-1116 ss-1]